MVLKEYDSDYLNYDEKHKKAIFGEFSSRPTEFMFLPDEWEVILGIIKHVKQIVDDPEENAHLEYFAKNLLEYELNSELKLAETVLGIIFSDNQEENCRQLINVMNNDTQLQPKDSEDKVEFGSHTHQLLSGMLSLADQNLSRSKPGRRFTQEIKLLATCIRTLGGPLLYEIIHRNLELALPSLDTTNRLIRNMDSPVVEGCLRSNELLNYLTDRKLPLVVALSEDATRIEGRLQYDSRSNQISGFVLPIQNETGMPIPLSFPARNVTEIVGHFCNKNPIAHFVNVIMAKPLADCPAFCLLVFASDTKYTAEEVAKRWAHITNELHNINIKALTIASDSDPKFNSAMRKKSLLGAKSNIFGNVDWFSSGLDEFYNGPFYLQDYAHLLTKLRNLLLRTKKNPRKLPFGCFLYINMSHLQFLLAHLQKDELPITASMLDPADRQNVDSARSICDEMVIMHIKHYLKRTGIGTAAFLQIMRDVMDAFTDKELSPLDRVGKIWYAVFLIRIWRQYIVIQEHLTLKHNFITQNCYVCIELNAHTLIHLMLYLKNNSLDDWFLPFLFDSQPCESFFRQVRALTSVYHRVANCSIKEIIGRINRIQLLDDIAVKTDFLFPRMKNKKDSKDQLNFKLPAKGEILKKICECRDNAIEFALNIGLFEDETSNIDLSCQISPLELKTANSNLRISAEIDEELLQITINKLKNVKLKNFAFKFMKDDIISESSPYVDVYNSKLRRIILKKSSTIWFLREEPNKLSSDRIHRVKEAAGCKKSTKMHKERPKIQKRWRKPIKRKKNHMIYKP